MYGTPTWISSVTVDGALYVRAYNGQNSRFWYKAVVRQKAGRTTAPGMTREVKAAEVLTHLAFYAGWPNAFSALPVVKDVFEKRLHEHV